MSAKACVKWPGGTRELKFEPPLSLEALLTLAGQTLERPCGGRGVCGKCRVKAAGALSRPDESERRLLGPDGLADGFRLSCRCLALGDLSLELPERGHDRIISGGYMPRQELAVAEGGLGLAVDIGTTTVVAYLYNLENGELLATASELNPQRVFGADVISRIQHSLEKGPDGPAEAIRECLNRLFSGLCEKAGRAPGELTRAVLAGNTAMMYLLCGHDPKSIAFAPFEPDHLFGEWLSAASLGLFGGAARTYLVPSVGAYVGGDITAAILSSDMLNAGGTSLLMDIGTNGEIVLLSNGRLDSCSTAAGPALEGAGIYRGMTASAGAVNAASVENGGLKLSVIPGREAEGICGTGIIDLVAALLELGAVDDTGRIEEDEPPLPECLCEIDGRPALRLPGTQIELTAADIRAVQLAKAAICAGAETLLHRAGIGPDKVERLYLAGGFGSYIDPLSAERIGLIPPGLAARSKALGNAAGAGAAMMLLSDLELERGAEIARTAQNVELSSDPFFSERYMDRMFF